MADSEILLTLGISAIQEAHIGETLQHKEVAHGLVLAGLLQDFEGLLEVVLRLIVLLLVHEPKSLLELRQGKNRLVFLIRNLYIYLGTETNYYR